MYIFARFVVFSQQELHNITTTVQTLSCSPNLSVFAPIIFLIQRSSSSDGRLSGGTKMISPCIKKLLVPYGGHLIGASSTLNDKSLSINYDVHEWTETETHEKRSIN
jgi:hypothetical protein